MTCEDLKSIRKALGLSQADFATAIGVSRDYVGRMERGVDLISVRTMAAIRQLAPPAASNAGRPLETTDPMERLVEAALRREGLRYIADRNGRVPENLDFHLPDYDVFIEVKRFHSPRIAEQTARAANVIVLQGEEAVRLFSNLLRGPAKESLAGTS